MTETQKLEEIGRAAVMRLRLLKLAKGFPFMFNSPGLPSTQCYFEYPDGRITIAELSDSADGFETIRELSEEETASLRNTLGLSVFHA
jgi:hypothetical protein